MAKPEPTGAPRAGAFTLVIGILELQRYQFPLLKLRGMCFVKETLNTDAAVYKTQLSEQDTCSGYGTEEQSL